MKRKQEKLSEKETEDKVNDLRLELVKHNVLAKKAGKTRIKEIKKAISRLLTFNKSRNGGVDKK